MDLFDLEREIAEVEKIRVAFIRPRSPYAINSYKALYPTPLSSDDYCAKLIERIISVVGHGCPFMLITDDAVTRYNTRKPHELPMH